jgi:nucleoside-diphosphate-sugar epimerase
MGTVNVFEAARLEKVSRVIFPSSGTVYLGSIGEGLQKIDESIPMNPPSVYAATKASCEFMGRAYAKRYGFEFICLRYVGGLYGPSPTALKATREIAIQDMIRAALKGEPAKVSWPYAPTEVLYGKDAAKGTVLAVLKDKFKDQLFHIGNGQLVGGDEILAAVKKHFPAANIELATGGNPMPYPESRLASDFSRSKEQLGYEPDYPIEKAVVDYAATLKRLENL